MIFNRIITFSIIFTCNNRKSTKNGFKRKNLNYKKVGDNYCNGLVGSKI